MVHSRTGEDRAHHPEICVRDVGGAQEDRHGRAVLFLDGPAQRRPVQRFRFRMPGADDHTTIYYWHYTLDPLPNAQQSTMQRWHLRWSRRAPSVTVQVATAAAPADLPHVERSFLAAVDAALRAQYLPDTARMGCERLPIRFTGRE
jgi:hypothetical protein